MPPTGASPLPARGISAGLLTLALLVAPAAPAGAQLGFTEFALTDTSLNSNPLTDFWIGSAAPADVDADGDLDLLIAGYFVVYPTEQDPDGDVEHRLTLYRNDGPAGGEWTLTPLAVDPGGMSMGATDLAWGDYDNDGDPDVVVASEGQTALFRNDAGNLVRTATVLPDYVEDSDFSTMDLRSVSWADVDNDGDLDLLLPALAGDFEWLPTAILRNDGPGVGDAWVFTNTGAVLPVAPNAVSAWADMEGDGDLDLLLGNVSPYETSFLGTWRNDAGGFVPAASGLALIRYGTADWGDADNDGDLDIVYGGNMDLPDGSGGETVVRILFNDGAGGFTPVDVVEAFGAGAPWLDFSAVSWADYDSDGDVDLLVCGEWLTPGEIEGRAVVYANQGGTFALASDPLPAPLIGNAGGAFTWFDIDGDGDLDYFVAGGYAVPGGNGLVEARAQLFRNDAPAANAAPQAPAAPTATVTGSDAILEWSPAGDDRTPTAALTYELEVARETAFAPQAGGATARALPQPGNVSGNTAWTLRALEPGAYRFRVRALDNAFNAGPAATGTFLVGGPIGVPGEAGGALALSPANPSPFTGATRLRLSMPRPGHVTVALHDARGHRVALVHQGPLGEGFHPLTIRSAGLASGVYFVQATALGSTAVRRIVVLHGERSAEP